MEFDRLLKQVSRSFYLTLKILPPQVQKPIALAYMLARAADTIADTEALPADQRLKYLQQFRQAFADNNSDMAQISSALSKQQNNPAEAELLVNLEALLGMLNQQPEKDSALIKTVLNTLSSGMVFDLETFPTEGRGVKALVTEDSLEHYTYMVAGCVGEFWTDICINNIAELKHWQRDEMVATGVRLGKALQYVNVLRDLPRDLRIGRCYLPLDYMEGSGLTPPDLFDVGNSARAVPLLNAGIATALRHFNAAQAYLFEIPSSQTQLRLAVLWPMLIGLRTLKLLQRSQGQWLDLNTTVKVSRGWIYRMMFKSLFTAGSDQRLRRWLDKLICDIDPAYSAEK